MAHLRSGSRWCRFFFIMQLLATFSNIFEPMRPYYAIVLLVVQQLSPLLPRLMWHISIAFSSASVIVTWTEELKQRWNGKQQFVLIRDLSIASEPILASLTRHYDYYLSVKLLHLVTWQRNDYRRGDVAARELVWPLPCSLSSVIGYLNTALIIF